MATPTYTVGVDWNNDGDFSDTGEDVTSRVRSSPGISCSRGIDQIRELSPPSAGRFDANLDNQSRDYSAENGSSPLAGNLLPGRPVRLQAVWNSTTYNLWRGFLDDLPQHPHRTELSVSIPSLGPLSRLAGKTISTGLYSNITTDVALGYILDAVSWPAGDRVLDTGKTTLQWWWLDEEDAFQAAIALLNVEGPGATLYEDGQGRIVFESRHYRILTSRSNTSQATFSDGGTEPIYSRPFQYNQGLKDIVNVITMTQKTRAAGSVSVVWSLGSTVSLASGETRKYLATSSDPFTGALFVAATDYTVTAGSLTTASLNRTSGTNVTITLTASAVGATVTGVQLRAQPVTTSNTTVVTNVVDTSSSKTKYGVKPFDISPVRNEISVNVAQDLVDAIAGRQQDPRPIVLLDMNNGTDSRTTQVLSREISDCVTVVETQTGIDDTYWINHIAHNIGQAGKAHVTTFGLEKIVGAQYFRFGIDTFGNGVFGF